VIWEKPNHNLLKLNTNASKFWNGEFGVAGALRDHEGNLQIAFLGRIQEVDSLQVEVRALLMGLQMCQLQNYNLNRIIAESDAIEMVQQLLSRSLALRGLEDLSHFDLIFKVNSFKHTFREANFLVDTLSRICLEWIQCSGIIGNSQASVGPFCVWERRIFPTYI
jgi:ribonuclease HI